jgi:hypothetical protein
MIRITITPAAYAAIAARLPSIHGATHPLTPFGLLL